MVNNSERLFSRIFTNQIKIPTRFYLGLSLSDSSENYFEPVDSNYKRADINFKEFEVLEKFNWCTHRTERIWVNMFSITFPESTEYWGLVKSCFVADEDNNVWLTDKLSPQRMIRKNTTVIFQAGQIKVNFE